MPTLTAPPVRRAINIAMKRDLSCPKCQAMIDMAAPPLPGSLVACPACGHKFAAAGSPPPLARGAATPPVPPRAATPPAIVAPPKHPRPPVPSRPISAPPVPAQAPVSPPPLAAIAPGGPPPLASAPSRATRMIFALAAAVLLTASGITAAVLLSRDEDETSEKQDSGKLGRDDEGDNDDNDSDGDSSGGGKSGKNTGNGGVPGLPGFGGGNGGIGGKGGNDGKNQGGGWLPGVNPLAPAGGDWETKETLLFSAEDGVTKFIPGSLRVSPDGSHHAFAFRKGDAVHWVVDGKDGPAFAFIDPADFVFSAEGGHYLCAGAESDLGPVTLVEDGRSFSGITEEIRHNLNLVESFQRVSDLAIAPEGQFAYVGTWGFGDTNGFFVDEQKLLVTNYIEVPRLTGATQQQLIVTAADKIRWARVISADQGYGVIIDGQLSMAPAAIRGALFSADGNSFGFVTSQNGLSFAVINGKPQKRHDAISSSSNSVLGDYSAAPGKGLLVFSPNGTRFAHPATHAGKNYVVVDNDRFETASEPVWPPTFSPDSQRWACADTRQGTYPDPNASYVLIDGVRGREYEAVTSAVAFSPDGGRVAYAASLRVPAPTADDPNATRLAAVLVLDDDDLGDFGWVGAPVFSPDSRHVACLAGDTEVDEKFMVLDGKRVGGTFLTALPPSFSPDSRSIGFVARNDDAWFVVLDGQARGGCDSIGPENSRVGFTPDGTYTYVAVRDGAYYWVEERRK